MLAAAAASLDAYMDEFWRRTQPHPFMPESRLLHVGGGVWLIVDLVPFDGCIYLKWLQIVSGSERQGGATRAMEQLTEMADRWDVCMMLEAKPTGTPKIPKGKLKAFYRRFGFVGQRGGDLMMRQPR